MHRIKQLLLVLFVILAFGTAQAELQVHILDVGEADCSILVCDGEAIVIDGGNAEDSALVYTYLKETLGLSEVKAVIATHPHEDHVGGIPGVMNACRVDTLYSPVADRSDSARFQTMLKYVAMQGLSVTIPKPGDSFTFGSAQCTFLSPYQTHEDINDDSLVVRIVYGSTAFLFMADAGTEAEQEILASGSDIHADVLRIGHHGSNSSTSSELLEAVSPRCAVISVGRDNDENHPSQAVLNRLNAAGITTVLRTDELGTIIFKDDGENIECSNLDTPESLSYETPYIGNINSMKFHKAGRKCAQNIAPSNQVPFETAEEALANGYTPCGYCKPK